MTSLAASPLALDDVRIRLAEPRKLALELRAGETLLVCGAQGCGKSTLIRVCAALVPPAAGRVLLFGRDAARLTRAELAIVHRRVGVVFENGALLDQLSVEENVALPLVYRGGTQIEDIRARVARCLAAVGMTDLAASRPSRLSLAERRRTALARALVFEPELLLLDDPTKALGSKDADGIVDLIARVRDLTHATLLLVASEDESRLKDLASRVAILDRGEFTSVVERQAAPRSNGNPDPGRGVGDAPHPQAPVERR